MFYDNDEFYEFQVPIKQRFKKRNVFPCELKEVNIRKQKKHNGKKPDWRSKRRERRRYALKQRETAS